MITIVAVKKTYSKTEHNGDLRNANVSLGNINILHTRKLQYALRVVSNL